MSACIRAALVLALIANLMNVCAATVMAADDVPRAARRVNPSAIREVERIRAQRGSVLEGSSFGGDADAGDNSDFSQAYERVANEHADSNSTEVPSRVTLPAPNPRERFASALREAARVLEATAADLEDAAAYDEADELRRRARKLRVHARQIGDFSPSQFDNQ